jgi:hypothetical protein
MKTAMQELLTYILVDCRNESGTIQFNAHETFNKFLEKEKEQIVNAYDRGYKACDLDEALEINKTMFSGEKYYEQTYKPETI